MKTIFISLCGHDQWYDLQTFLIILMIVVKRISTLNPSPFITVEFISLNTLL